MNSFSTLVNGLGAIQAVVTGHKQTALTAMNNAEDEFDNAELATEDVSALQGFLSAAEGFASTATEAAGSASSSYEDAISV